MIKKIAFALLLLGPRFAFASGGYVSTFPGTQLVASSTTATMGALSSSQTTFQGCSTTLTFTTNGNNVRIWLHSSVTKGATATDVIAFVLEDGKFFDSESTTVGMMDEGIALINSGANIGFEHLRAAPSAGSHSYCLGVISSGSSTSFDALAVNQFGIAEQQ